MNQTRISGHGQPSTENRRLLIKANLAKY